MSAKSVAGLVVLALFLVGLMMPMASAAGRPAVFKVMQMGGTFKVDPVESPQSAVAFYDYWSASGHTPFMEDLVSKIYVYRDTSTGELSLIMHHSIDNSVSGNMRVDFDLEGVPAGAYTALSDDPVHAWNATRPGGREFDLTLAPEGNWYHGANSDGGIVGGLPTDWGWCITVHPNFIAGIIAWQYQKPMSDWNIELDMDQPVTICYIPPMPTRHSSWVRDPKYDHEPGPAYGDILKAGVDGPVGYWTGSDWEPAIILRMQVHGRIPDTAPPCMPTTISSFSWRFDLDGDGAWDVVILIESDGAPGDPDPGAGTWSLVKWTQELMGYDSVMGTFRIIHESWPGWGDVDKLEVIVPLGELGYATGFDWIALNTHWPAWLDQAPDSGWAPW